MVNLLEEITPDERVIVDKYRAAIPVRVAALAQELGLEIVLAPLSPSVSGMIEPSETAPNGFKIHHLSSSFESRKISVIARHCLCFCFLAVDLKMQRNHLHPDFGNSTRLLYRIHRLVEPRVQSTDIVQSSGRITAPRFQLRPFWPWSDHAHRSKSVRQGWRHATPARRRDRERRNHRSAQWD